MCHDISRTYLNMRKKDNTNADRETRTVWVQLAEHFKIPIRCVYFTAPAKLCEHNDAVRAIAGNQFNPEKRAILPHTAFSSFASRFKQPRMEEGFQDVVPVHFNVGRPGTGSGCKLIYSYSSKVTMSNARSGVVTGSRQRAHAESHMHCLACSLATRNEKRSRSLSQRVIPYEIRVADEVSQHIVRPSVSCSRHSLDIDCNNGQGRNRGNYLFARVGSSDLLRVVAVSLSVCSLMR